jgi:hypothetical protein
MNSDLFSNLRFERRFQMHLSRKTIWLIISILGYLLAWNIFPTSILFWLGLPIFTILAWLSSYSWKEGLKALDQVIRRLEKL